MDAKDVMTTGVISVPPETPVIRAVSLMLQYDLSALPIVDRAGKLVGIVTEGDFLRRPEIGTERHRTHWLELLLGPGRLAGEYVHTHGGKVEEVMTRRVVTVREDTPLNDVVRLMESERIKRVPVMRGEALVGIVSRRDLLHAFVARAKKATPDAGGDAAIRETILAEIEKQPWAPRNAIAVSGADGLVELRGAITDERQREALRVLAESVPGVKGVHDLLAITGTVYC